MHGRFLGMRHVQPHAQTKAPKNCYPATAAKAYTMIITAPIILLPANRRPLGIDN